MTYKTLFLILIIMYISIFFVFSTILNKNIKKYLTYNTKNNISTKKVINDLINEKNIKTISLENTDGYLSDHYDINTKTIYLSDCNNSIISKIIALHEFGHVMQDNENYLLLKIKTKLLPFFNIINVFSIIFLIIGFLSSNILFNIGTILIALSLLFQILITLIEYNASKRIYNYIKNKNIFTKDEFSIMNKILRLSTFEYLFSLFNNIFKTCLVFKK